MPHASGMQRGAPPRASLHEVHRGGGVSDAVAGAPPIRPIIDAVPACTTGAERARFDPTSACLTAQRTESSPALDARGHAALRRAVRPAGVLGRAAASTLPPTPSPAARTARGWWQAPWTSSAHSSGFGQARAPGATGASRPDLPMCPPALRPKSISMLVNFDSNHSCLKFQTDSHRSRSHPSGCAASPDLDCCQTGSGARR